MVLKHFITAGILLYCLVYAQQDEASSIEYNVISMLNRSLHISMCVIVDNTSYPLNSNSSFPILYTGKAPLALLGYQYARVTLENSTQPEPFIRHSVNMKTPNEFFNRTWNSRDNAQFPQVYPPLKSIHRIQSNLHKHNEIPTVHITGDQTMIDAMHHNVSADIKFKSNLTYLSLKDALKFQGVEVSLSGRSSRWMPKLSYNLKLKKGENMYGYREIKLRSLYLDPTYLREQVAYDFVKSMGLASSDFSFVRVFMNDQELGLFGMIDIFTDSWLSNMFANGDRSYKNGYLYQGVYTSLKASQQKHISDLSFYENSTAYEDGQYKIKEKASGSKNDDYKPLINFTKFIVNPPTNSPDVVKKWNEQIDMDSFLRSLVLEVLMGHSDGHLAMADNYYLYQDPKERRFIYIPSDMDTTLGVSIVRLQKMISGNYSTFPGWGLRPLVNQIMQVPEFKHTFENLLQVTTDRLVNPKTTRSRIDDLAAMIEEDVAWDKSLSRVSLNLFSNGQEQSNEAKSEFGSMSNPEFCPDAFFELSRIPSRNLSLDTALNGPINSEYLIGINEWIKKIHQNTISFFHNQ
ncbi:coth protein-domain-containing protein [Sporodiniella umbellata]|nr:coth protein-domain-containing protein [Sporodiniella umbellata]